MNATDDGKSTDASASNGTTDRRGFLRRTGAVAATGLVGLAATTGSASAHSGRYSIISTRGRYNGDGELKSGHNSWEFDTWNVPGEDRGCVGEYTVYVHGFRNGHDDAVGSGHEALHHLMNHGYVGHLSVFSWDSDVTNWDWNDWGGFGDAQQIAEQNGHALANVLYRQREYFCGGTTLRLVCHSLGAKVVEYALRTLRGWWGGEDQVATVHVLGGAVDNEAWTDERGYNFAACRDETGALFNYHNWDDSVLSGAYRAREWDRAVGHSGAETGNATPGNYYDIDVTDRWDSDHGHGYYLQHCAGSMVYHMANDHRYD